MVYQSRCKAGLKACVHVRAMDKSMPIPHEHAERMESPGVKIFRRCYLQHRDYLYAICACRGHE